MGERLLGAVLLACSLGFGQLISTSHNVTTKTGNGVVARLDWTGELRGPSTLHVTARGMAPQTLSLSPFLQSGVAFTPVSGPGDGCGASTNLAIIPKTGSPLPYVVVFAVLAEKGCLPVPVVFVPLRTAKNYAYVGARYFQMWSSEPKSTGKVRVASTDRIMLAHSTIAGMSGAWPVEIVVNALPAGPRVIAIAPPDKPKEIREGSTIVLGRGYDAWFENDAVAHHL